MSDTKNVKKGDNPLFDEEDSKCIAKCQVVDSLMAFVDPERERKLSSLPGSLRKKAVGTSFGAEPVLVSIINF